MTRILAALSLLLALAGCASDLAAPRVGVTAVDSSQLLAYWTELATGSGAQARMNGIWICQASGDWTGGGSLTLMTQKADGATWVAITSPAGLVGAAADTAWVELKARGARYRPTITGAVADVDLECGRVVY